jgi:nicotinamidase-related amidase
LLHIEKEQMMNSALIVIDVQRDVVANACRPGEVIANIVGLVDRAREERGVERLVVCGAQTDACIRSTLHGAIARGYNATLVSDAHTTDDCSWATPPLSAEQVIAHTNFYWNWQRTPRAAGGTNLAAEVVFS